MGGRDTTADSRSDASVRSLISCGKKCRADISQLPQKEKRVMGSQPWAAQKNARQSAQRDKNQTADKCVTESSKHVTVCNTPPGWTTSPITNTRPVKVVPQTCSGYCRRGSERFPLQTPWVRTQRPKVILSGRRNSYPFYRGVKDLPPSTFKLYTPLSPGGTPQFVQVLLGHQSLAV